MKDVQYSFFAKDVGKVAEIEALKVSAVLIYHSNDKTAKVLATKPELAKSPMSWQARGSSRATTACAESRSARGR